MITWTMKRCMGTDKYFIRPCVCFSQFRNIAICTPHSIPSKYWKYCHLNQSYISITFPAIFSCYRVSVPFNAAFLTFILSDFRRYHSTLSHSQPTNNNTRNDTFTHYIQTNVIVIKYKKNYGFHSSFSL